MIVSWSLASLGIPTIFILLTVIPTFVVGLYRLFLHPLAKIPGPFLAKFTSLWHVYHTYRGHDSTLVRELHRQQGKIVRIGPNTVDIADGAALHPIYVDKGGFMKTADYHKFYVDGFPTIFSTSDPVYRASRYKAVAAFFSIAATRRQSSRLSACVERFVQRLQESRVRSKGSPVDLQEPARILGFDVLSTCLFQHQYPDNADGASEKSIIPWLNAFVDSGQLFYFSRRWFDIYLSILGRWRGQKDIEDESAEAVHDYALNLPVVASDDSEKSESYQGRLHKLGIPREQIAAECKDIMFAGMHSFGGLLATTLWYLANDAAVHDRLQDELLEYRESGIDIQQLPYLSGVVKEGFRLAPVNTRLPRVVPRSGWHYDGHYLPSGTVVGIAATQLYFDPDVYEDPDAFRPERWAKPSREMERDLIPFSVGLRQCIARNLATAELFMAVKQVAESDVLRGAKSVVDKIETYEWFNLRIKGNRVDLVWPEDRSTQLRGQDEL
ncbi:MAG: hypothetical protein Q9178_000522 [Gyalolechia marmorata]